MYLRKEDLVLRSVDDEIEYDIGIFTVNENMMDNVKFDNLGKKQYLSTKYILASTINNYNI
jgi:hypothetical protein